MSKGCIILKKGVETKRTQFLKNGEIEDAFSEPVNLCFSPPFAYIECVQIKKIVKNLSKEFIFCYVSTRRILRLSLLQTSSKIVAFFQLKFYGVELRRGLKCADYLRNETLFELQSVWVAEDDEKIGAGIARTAECEVDINALYLPDEATAEA